jgi:hypothetical protein
MRNLAIFSLVAALASGLARSSAGVQVVPGVPLTPTHSPDGSVSVALPAGWNINASSQGDSLTMTPAGRTQPSVIMALFTVSDLRYAARITACSRSFNPLGNMLTSCVIPSVRMQLQDSSRPWTPQEAAQIVMQRLQQTGRASFGLPQWNPVSPTQAYYRVSSTGPGGVLDNWGSITMFHFANPTLGPGEVTSLALLAGCSAPSGQAESFYATCAGIIRSLRPSPEWGNRFASVLVNGYAQEAQALINMGWNVANNFAYRQQMITAAGQAVQEMQQEAFERRQAQIVHDAEHWSAALRGDDIVRDPQTGKLYSVPHGYQQYCIDDNALDPTIIASNGTDVMPGSLAGKHVCARIMSQVP